MAGQFTIDLQRFAKRANADVKQAIRKITLEAFKRVILRTPVDTGLTDLAGDSTPPAHLTIDDLD